MSSVYYSFLDKENNILWENENSSCFYELFVEGIGDIANKNATTLVIFINEIYLKIHESNKYFEYLTTWGFPAKLIDKDTIEFKKCHGSIGNNTEKYYKIVLNLSDYNTKGQLCSALTLIRYIFENPYECIVTEFFKLLIKLPNYDDFKLFQQAHLVSNGGSGHDLKINYKTFFIGLSEIFNRFEKDGKDIYSPNNSSAYVYDLWKTLGLPASFLINKTKKEIYAAMNNEITRKVYVVGGDIDYVNWIDIEITETLSDAHLVVFTGGEDVDPSMYGRTPHPLTSSNLSRDKKEEEIFFKAKELKIPMLGICRGAQFLGVMNGATLIQHQDNPKFIHPLILNTGDTGIYITSTHHQSVNIESLEKYSFVNIAYTRNISKFHEDENRLEIPLHMFNSESEIVFYKKTNCLGIQGHPEIKEFQDNPLYKKSMDYFKYLVEELIAGTNQFYSCIY
jgi:putative glutamine amidotransferase